MYFDWMVQLDGQAVSPRNVPPIEFSLTSKGRPKPSDKLIELLLPTILELEQGSGIKLINDRIKQNLSKGYGQNDLICDEYTFETILFYIDKIGKFNNLLDHAILNSLINLNGISLDEMIVYIYCIKYGWKYKYNNNPRTKSWFEVGDNGVWSQTGDSIISSSILWLKNYFLSLLKEIKKRIEDIVPSLKAFGRNLIDYLNNDGIRTEGGGVFEIKPYVLDTLQTNYYVDINSIRKVVENDGVVLKANYFYYYLKYQSALNTILINILEGRKVMSFANSWKPLITTLLTDRRLDTMNASVHITPFINGLFDYYSLDNKERGEYRIIVPEDFVSITCNCSIIYPDNDDLFKLSDGYKFIYKWLTELFCQREEVVETDEETGQSITYLKFNKEKTDEIIKYFMFCIGRTLSRLIPEKEFLVLEGPSYYGKT
jgi:hypothetical protein